MRAVVDHHVDRPDVDAQQCVQLTGPNRSIALESPPRSPSVDTHSMSVIGHRASETPDAADPCPLNP